MTIAGAAYREGVAYSPDGAMYVTSVGGTQSATSYSATGQFLAADGSGTAPGYAYTSEPGLGMGRIGAGTLGWSSQTAYRVSMNTVALFPTTDAAMTLGTAGNKWSRIYIDYTNTATVGAVTINKAAGRVNIGAAGTSVVVTNSLVTAASHVIAVMSSADATGRVTSVVPAAGSFTINTVAVTAQASFDFFVINAD